MDPQKSSSAKKWLVGCGIGCGAVIILVIILVVGGVVFVKDMVNSFEESEDILKELTNQYGSIKDFYPSPLGVIKSERMEAFLEIRERIQPDIEELEKTVGILSDQEEQDQIEKEESAGVLKKIRTGIGLVPKIAEFLKERNQALLEVGMGMGEYYYIYTLAYYCWLDKPVADGLPINMNENNEFDYQSWEDPESQEIRRDLAVRRLNQMILPMLKNQYVQLMKMTENEIPEQWKTKLEQEIEALEANRYRLVWQEGLPQVIVDSFRPYKDRLESSYSSSLNNIEIIIEQR